MIMRTHAVGLDDTHVMTIDPEEECRERARVHDAKTISLSGLEWEGCVLVETDGTGHGVGVCARNGTKVCSILGEIDEGRVCRQINTVSISSKQVSGRSMSQPRSRLHIAVPSPRT